MERLGQQGFADLQDAEIADHALAVDARMTIPQQYLPGVVAHLRILHGHARIVAEALAGVPETAPVAFEP